MFAILEPDPEQPTAGTPEAVEWMEREFVHSALYYLLTGKNDLPYCNC